MFLHIDFRMIVEAFAVVDRRFLDFLDGGVDFGNCDVFTSVDLVIAGLTIQESTSRAEVGQGVDVTRMLAG